MEILTEPKHEGGRRRVLVVALLAVAVLVAAAVALWLVARRPTESPKGPPVAPRARASPSPGAAAAPPAAPEARATPRPRLEPRAEAAAPTLRVDADVPGANVFLDRKFLGTTPVEGDERIDVAHKHGVGSCRGRLVATTTGLRYEGGKADDSFEAPFSSLEPLEVDYLNRNLRVKRKGGKTWNFTADSTDALLTFQRAVESARKRL